MMNFCVFPIPRSLSSVVRMTEGLQFHLNLMYNLAPSVGLHVHTIRTLTVSVVVDKFVRQYVREDTHSSIDISHRVLLPRSLETGTTSFVENPGRHFCECLGKRKLVINGDCCVASIKVVYRQPLVSRPCMVHLFALASLSSLHHFLICAVYFWLNAFWLAAHQDAAERVRNSRRRRNLRGCAFTGNYVSHRVPAVWFRPCGLASFL